LQEKANERVVVMILFFPVLMYTKKRVLNNMLEDLCIDGSLITGVILLLLFFSCILRVCTLLGLA